MCYYFTSFAVVSVSTDILVVFLKLICKGYLRRHKQWQKIIKVIPGGIQKDGTQIILSLPLSVSSLTLSCIFQVNLQGLFVKTQTTAEEKAEFEVRYWKEKSLPLSVSPLTFS